MAILRCTCDHSYQDSAHGKKMRVKNPTKKGTADRTVYRCSVCLSESSSK